MLELLLSYKMMSLPGVRPGFMLLLQYCTATVLAEKRFFQDKFQYVETWKHVKTC